MVIAEHAFDLKRNHVADGSIHKHAQIKLGNELGEYQFESPHIP